MLYKTLVTCVLLLSAVSVQATTAYDFNSLGTGNINGKDGWSSNGLNGYIYTPGGYSSAGSDICVTTYGGTGTGYGTRQNNAGWGYDLSSGTAFTMGAAFRVDYQLSGYYGRAEVLITNSTTGRSIGFGYEVMPWYYSAYIQDAFGTEINLGNLGLYKGAAVDMYIEVDPAANGGEGSARLFAQKDDGGFVQFGAPQNLNLLSANALMTQADGIRLEVKTRLGAIDDVYVTPEPATMLLLGLGGVLLRKGRGGLLGK